ncbi:MAG: SDR family NAD(P)-dependent oxidoreductase [Burkholderiaceae bacterium]|nr:SDR family NAD(P)-dependent oxidoreductase [Burkholderiaceae bacterium]
MTGSNAGRVAWITGGATGIGFATARALGDAGWTVVLSGRRAKALEDAVAALPGGRASIEPLDVADAEAAGQAAAAIVARHGRIDALIASAGTNVPDRAWKKLRPEGFAKVAAINLGGVANCVIAALPTMREAGAGTIVVVSSWAGWRYLPFAGAAYGATKMGLGPLVESLNYEEGQNGIRATLLCPGEVATPILRSRPVPVPEPDLARMLQPEDVAEAIAYAVTAPARVCINELVISPSWNRIYLGAEDLEIRR